MTQEQYSEEEVDSTSNADAEPEDDQEVVEDEQDHKSENASADAEIELDDEEHWSQWSKRQLRDWAQTVAAELPPGKPTKAESPCLLL
jgi:hypothetical protein